MASSAIFRVRSGVGKRSSSALFCVLLAVASLAQGQDRQSTADQPPVSTSTPVASVDRVVAVVNDEVVTRRELDRAVVAARNRLATRRDVTLPADEVLDRQVLETLIIERAQAQVARRNGLQINDGQLDRAIDGIAEQNRLTIAQLRARLIDEGISFAEFREDIRSQMIRARLRETEVESRIKVSDADIDAWLAEQQGRGMRAAEMNVGQLFLALPEKAPPSVVAELEKVARELLAQLRSSADFGAMVASRSEAATGKADSGSLGWRTLDQLPRLFADAVSSLEVGQISDIVRSPAGLHILKVLDKRGGDSELDKPIPQTHVRHILIRPSASLSEAEIVRRLESVRDRVRGGEVAFEAMARQYSVDGSAGNGGDLGWVYAGDTVPEFELAMDGLQPGQISDPVRTQFGFHLIQVLERREDRASDERRRQLARQEVIKRRADSAWREWLEELRARTYVEYRLEQ